MSGERVVVSEVYKETVGPVDREDAGIKLVFDKEDLRSVLRALLMAAPKIGVVSLDLDFEEGTNANSHSTTSHVAVSPASCGDSPKRTNS